MTDVHTHYVPRGWPALPGTGPRPSLRVDGPATATILLGERPFRAITDSAWNADVRLAHMDAHGVDRQVLSPTPVFFSYEQEADAAARTAAVFNDLALGIAAEAPGRLLPFCQVPLQDTDAACRELDQAVAAGHAGVEIGNHVGDRDLDDVGIVTFLQHAAALGVPVFVHPWDMPESLRTSRWMAQWLVGMPAETHLSVLALVLGGVFDEIGPELRICFAHGGGSFPFWVGRMDNAWRERHDVVGTSALPPSGYLDRFFVDSVVFDERALRLLVDTLGAERVLLGTDYPYPLGEQAPGSLIRGASFLTEDRRDLLLGGNAEAFLGLPGREGTR
ncbi:amidohydrolase family protein [Pseudonocardia kujensis]|uniref:amidohydrolase family protein n=1 Tax=Pseudonocardia kujensis TaxID=1128675 RepID=UPI001E5314CC|nr:amidohydrolase family protein [Pseudonocardia kujensis]MCE0766225.1 amidohydrolase family protein [Pseudonocardia kujensis]